MGTPPCATWDGSEGSDMTPGPLRAWELSFGLSGAARGPRYQPSQPWALWAEDKGEGRGARDVTCPGWGDSERRGEACPQGGRSCSPTEVGALEPWASVLAVRFRSLAAGPCGGPGDAAVGLWAGPC